MPLISCPDCQRQVSDAAAACPQCGYPIAGHTLIAKAAQPVSQAYAPVETDDPAKPATWVCPKCGTQGCFRTFEMLHREGTSVVNTKSGTTGIGVGGGALGIGFASTRTAGTSQSQLAGIVAPPEPDTSYKAKYVIGLIVGIVAMIAFQSSPDLVAFALIIPIIAGIVWGTRARHEYEKNVWPGLVQRWRNSYMCTCCGATRIVNA